MRVCSAAAFAALCALLLPAGASARGRSVRPAHLPEGTPVVIVGQVHSPPNEVNGEHKMQVSVGPRRLDYTLHFGDARVLKGPNGEEINRTDFDDGQWVRAEGRVMDDSRRIKVSRIRMISTRKMGSLHGTPYNRRGFSYGCLQWPAGEAKVAGWRGTVYRAAP